MSFLAVLAIEQRHIALPFSAQSKGVLAHGWPALCQQWATTACVGQTSDSLTMSPANRRGRL